MFSQCQCIYKLAVVPFIRKLAMLYSSCCFQVWFADDANVIGSASIILEWWHHPVATGQPQFFKAGFSWLLATCEHLSQAELTSYIATVIIILLATVQGQQHLEVLGSCTLLRNMFQSKWLTGWPDITAPTNLSTCIVILPIFPSLIWSSTC